MYIHLYKAMQKTAVMSCVNGLVTCLAPINERDQVSRSSVDHFFLHSLILVAREISKRLCMYMSSGAHVLCIVKRHMYLCDLLSPTYKRPRPSVAIDGSTSIIFERSYVFVSSNLRKRLSSPDARAARSYDPA